MTGRMRGRAWSTIRARILNRDGYTCQVRWPGAACLGGPLPSAQLHVDHRTPLAMGGSDDEQNLQAACVNCNRAKGARAVPAGTAARRPGW